MQTTRFRIARLRSSSFVRVPTKPRMSIGVAMSLRRFVAVLCLTAAVSVSQSQGERRPTSAAAPYDQGTNSSISL